MPRLIDLGDVLAVINASMLNLEYTDENRAMQKAISMLPTVDAVPVRYGRWQVNEMFGHKDMTCLSCGWLFEYYDGLEEEWNYCPHCGALQSFAIATKRREDGDNH